MEDHSVDKLKQARCRQSPTRRHWWMIPMTGAHPIGCCKYCGREREFDNTAGDGRWPVSSQTIFVRRKERLGKL